MPAGGFAGRAVPRPGATRGRSCLSPSWPAPPNPRRTRRREGSRERRRGLVVLQRPQAEVVENSPDRVLIADEGEDAQRWPQRVQTRGSTSSSRTRGAEATASAGECHEHALPALRRTTAVRSRVRRDRTSRTPVALVRPPGAAPRAARTKRAGQTRSSSSRCCSTPGPRPGGESPAASAGGRPACHVDKARRAHGQARSGLSPT